MCPVPFFSFAQDGISPQAKRPRRIFDSCMTIAGPCWHKDKLFYTEYGAHTVKTWDGKTNQTFWQQNDCGPSAVVPVANDEMLVTCYDSDEIVRISSTGKTVKAYKNDKDGQTFLGPND
jgi:gluconolactonase